MNQNEIAEAQRVHVAFVDDELLTHSNRIAEAKIQAEKEKIAEQLRYEKQRIKHHHDVKNRIQEEIMREEKLRIEALREYEEKSMKAEQERQHIAWRLQNPDMADEEDRLKRLEHQQQLERIQKQQDAVNQAAYTTAKVAAGAVLGGAIAFFM